ncbi:HAD family phosphatase [uncultured Holdemanella sp.]|uniref:HAD family hydrolase n=1 Tax=uncultured Holdemanella sp. TaxID=1763549 RepID=UPI0025D5E99F|nr:HAD family phosphatase [uncultured Holdemanella sp.]
MKAIIFDMDGVLINSEVKYQELFMQFFKERGVFVEKEELLFLVGSSRKMEDAFIANRLNVSVERAKCLKETFFENQNVDYLKIRMPYVMELLEYLKNKDVTMALASSSPMENIVDVLKQCEIETYFKYIVSGENFKRTKPDPEIYEYTSKQLGVSKDEIWVVEDSEYGIEAAKNAGLKVIGLYNRELYQDLTDANLIISSLKQIMEEDIW